MISDFEGFLYPRSYPLHYFLILILKKEPVFSLFNVEGLTRALSNWNTILQTGMLEEYIEDHIISNHVTSICNLHFIYTDAV